MPIDGTRFGEITIDGRVYDHDVIIRLSGKVEKRRKRLSKEEYGTSHVISKAEAKFVFEDGRSSSSSGPASMETCASLPKRAPSSRRKKCRVVVEPTPQALATFNHVKGKKIALMHVTC